MAATKRKAESAAAPAKKDKSASSDKPAKRARKSDTAPEETRTAKITKAQKSVFKNEETSFPRGGASVLTPLEHKQIQAQANQDVLFEQAGIKRTGDDGFSDSGSDADAQDAPKSDKKRKSKKMNQLPPLAQIRKRQPQTPAIPCTQLVHPTHHAWPNPNP